jgi:N-acetylglucosamine-6-phosphate deacetylase
VAALQQWMNAFEFSGKLQVNFQVNFSPISSLLSSRKTSPDCSIEYVLEAASLHPAKCLGIEKEKGTLNFGADADLVFLDEDLTIWSTWIGGDCVYQNDKVQEAKYLLKEKLCKF